MAALAYHVIFGTYGFWLPNDPRGSWSKYVASWELLRFGRATEVQTGRSLASVPHDQERRQAAKLALKYPPVQLSGRQALAVIRGFDRALQESGYVVHACSILPDHVHMVIADFPRRVRRIVGHFKARATQQLIAEGLWLGDGRPVWAEHSWTVFLNAPSEVTGAIAYVEDNPPREGKRRQRWSFVTPYVPKRSP